MDDDIIALLNRPTISVTEAGRVLNMCRNAAYDAVRRGDIESLVFGKRKIVIPTAPLRRKLGIEADLLQRASEAAREQLHQLEKASEQARQATEWLARSKP